MNSDYQVSELGDWSGTERRAIDSVTLQLMAEMRHSLEKHEKMEEQKFQEIKSDIDAHRLESDRRHEELCRRIDNMSQSTMTVIGQINATSQEMHKLFKAAIPNEDPEGHRRAHETWIKKSEKEEEFALDIKKKAVGAVVVAVIFWVGIALWTAFLQGPK
jgi:hypothetical protein